MCVCGVCRLQYIHLTEVLVCLLACIAVCYIIIYYYLFSFLPPPPPNQIREETLQHVSALLPMLPEPLRG